MNEQPEEKEQTAEDVASIPGMDADVYFQNPTDKIPNWREVLPRDDEDDEPTQEEINVVKSLVGFDFDKPLERKNLQGTKIKPSPFEKK